MSRIMRNKIQLISFIILLSLNYSARGQNNVVLSRDSTYVPPVELESFEITATKEKDELQQLPMAASALKSRNIDHQEMDDMTELTSRVPNLFMPDYGSKLTSPIYIRGIGSRINSPSVGLYVDNVPYFEKAAFNFEFFDVESIEVLRGPQGTLYGRNTMGGIINVKTKSPGKTRETDFSVRAANYNSYKAAFGHHQPVNDKFGFSLNGAFVDRDGFQTNEFTGDPADDLRSYSGRFRAQYEPSDNLKIEYSLNYEDSDQNGYPYAEYTDSTNTAKDVNYNKESIYNRKMLSNNLTLEYETGHSIIKSVTSHQYLDDQQGVDQDFTPASLFYVDQFQEQHMISQELYFKGKPEEETNYQWLCGAFGFTQFSDKHVAVDYGEDAIPAFNLPGNINYDKFYDQNTSGFAFFHQSTVNDFMFDGLSVTAGIRFDYESASLDYQHDQFLDGNQYIDDSFESTLDFWEVLPKMSIKYQIAERVNTYATVSKGYKTGGFNSSFAREQDRTFDPEVSWNYELGIKSRYFKNRLQTNLALFYIDWTKQQIYQPVIDEEGEVQPGSMLKNAGKSESKGIELEFRGLPTTHTEAYVSFGYTDASFVDYVDGEDDFSGNRIPYIPEYTFHAGFTYRHQFDYDMLDAVMFQADYRGVGKHYWQEENASYQNYYGLLNSKISFKKDRFELSLYGKNLLNEDYQAFYFRAMGRSYAQIGQPAIYGMKLKVSF
ncbi:MAG: TonB-dependent receptor [Bacteroidota bacterium]